MQSLKNDWETAFEKSINKNTISLENKEQLSLDIEGLKYKYIIFPLFEWFDPSLKPYDIIFSYFNLKKEVPDTYHIICAMKKTTLEKSAPTYINFSNRVKQKIDLFRSLGNLANTLYEIYPEYSNAATSFFEAFPNASKQLQLVWKEWGALPKEKRNKHFIPKLYNWLSALRIGTFRTEDLKKNYMLYLRTSNKTDYFDFATPSGDLIKQIMQALNFDTKRGEKIEKYQLAISDWLKSTDPTKDWELWEPINELVKASKKFDPPLIAAQVYDSEKSLHTLPLSSALELRNYSSKRNYLEQLIVEKIKMHGDMPYSQFVNCALHFPGLGYYKIIRHVYGEFGTESSSELASRFPDLSRAKNYFAECIKVSAS